MNFAKLEATSVRNSWMLEISKFGIAVLFGFATAGWSARGKVSDVETRVSVLETRVDGTTKDIADIRDGVKQLITVLIDQQGKK